MRVEINLKLKPKFVRDQMIKIFFLFQCEADLMKFYHRFGYR